MRAELVQARAASAGGCQEGGDAAGNVTDAARARSEAAQLARENAALRETVLALHSELFGARLATKYLDKELAGRIQQLQLLGRDMRAELRDSLWAQVEAEILVQRHKTLVRVCRGAGAARGMARPPPAPHPALEHAPHPGRALARTVRVRRSPHLGLGISVTHGAPPSRAAPRPRARPHRARAALAASRTRHLCYCEYSMARPPPAPHPGRALARTVRVRRSPHLGLGISVTHGAPPSRAAPRPRARPHRARAALAASRTRHLCYCEYSMARPPPAPHPGRALARTVRVRRSPHLGLGISVTVSIAWRAPLPRRTPAARSPAPCACGARRI
ncbi:hypothetical protein PYW07_015194 [Mythimna separata]|uniref:Uncharacterized protein n=1 Tax=Mythimna separata TaxID=271217 RepID=A0AAD7YWV7_MYTSE|nr:hypothetical protein PYW07_015194 [Mythimna separata]